MLNYAPVKGQEITMLVYKSLFYTKFSAFAKLFRST